MGHFRVQARKQFVVMLALALWGLPDRASGWVPYNVYDLGTVGSNQTRPQDMNDINQIAGVAYPDNHAFQWESGVIKDIGTLGGTRALAWAMNNAGQVTGQSYNSSGVWHAFLWSKSGGMQDLGVPSGQSRSLGLDVNENAQVAGMAYTGNEANCRAVLWDNGGWTDMGTLGGSWAKAKAINNSGHAVGWSYTTGDASQVSVMWKDGAIINLGNIAALDINDSDQVLGLGAHALVWENGTVTDLGTLGGTQSYGNHINNAGQVAGWAYNASEAMTAVVWDHGVITNVNTLLPPGSGWSLLNAIDINANGWIVGRGYYGGQDRAFVLVPVPEPGAFALLAAFALATLAGRRRPPRRT
jgi:probable HAF family extracellular repeat protein